MLTIGDISSRTSSYAIQDENNYWASRGTLIVFPLYALNNIFATGNAFQTNYHQH
jgi:hypothetical protein